MKWDAGFNRQGTPDLASPLYHLGGIYDETREDYCVEMRLE